MKKADIGIALYLLAAVIFFIVPIPDVLLDVMLSINISIALIIMFRSLFSREVLDMSFFPTLLLFIYCAIYTKMDLEWINKNLDFLTLFFVQYFKFGKRLTNRKIADTIIPKNKILLCFPHRKFRQTEITSIFNFQIYEC